MTNNSNSSILERSVNSLQWFYTMVLSLAVVHAVQQILVYDSTNQQFSLNLGSLHNFMVFLVIVIPFYQGANRYLDETYVSGNVEVKEMTGLVDFLFFFIEGMIFYSMAILINNNYYFYLSVLTVLGVDIVWLIFVYFANNELFKKIYQWLILNIITILIILILITINVIDEKLKYYILSIILFIRTVADYYLSWPFYWPSFASNNEASK